MLNNIEADDIDRETWPSTINEAAARIVANLSPAERAGLASLSDGDLFAQHFGMGMQIRNNFGLWRGNTQLLDECTLSSRSPIRGADHDEPVPDEALLFIGRMDADGASHTILRAARDLARSLL